MTACCRVKNADFLEARSDLWQNVINAFMKCDRITIARPQQEIYLVNNDQMKSEPVHI